MAQGDLLAVFSAAFTSHAATRDVTGSVAVAVGDLVVVNVIQQIGIATTGVTDNLGNTYVSINGSGTDAGAVTGCFFYSRVTNAGTLTTVTVAGAVSSNDVTIIAGIFEGPFEAPPLDANPADGTSDVTSPFTCPATGTLAQADELVIAFGGANIVSAGSTTWAATSPNLLVDSLGTAAIVASMGYQIVAATTSVAPEFTAAVNPSGSVVLGTASFKLTATGDTYTLDADAAAYTYSATAAGLEFDRQIVPEAASYTYTASAAGLEFDRQLVADSAAYTWSATDAGLEYTPAGSTYELAADSAAYLWSATDAALEYVRIYSLDADASAFVWTASDAGLEYSGAAQQQPTGGWSSLPRDFGRGQTAEARRRERERLGIEPAQQRAIDRAAVKIAPVVTQGGLVSPQAVIAAPAFDRLLTAIRPTEGEVMALAQAIIDRILWMMAEQEEEEAVVRLMMEMD